MSSESLSNNLTNLLKSADSKDLTVESIFTQVGDKGFGLLLIILALPSALPLPAAGYSTPFGLIISFLGIQMLIGKKIPWLPQWALKIKIRYSLAEKMVKSVAAFFNKVEHLIKPRMSWISSQFGLPIMGIIIIVMACLMILPIPLTNTAPAMVIFLVGIGLSEDDGIVAGFASVLGTMAIALYAYIIYLFMTVGVEAVEQLKDVIKEKIGM